MKMNIQKSRFAAMVTVMLMVCMMVATMIVPASAAVVEEEFYYCQMFITEERSLQLHTYLCDCEDYLGEEFSVEGYTNDSGTLIVNEQFLIQWHLNHGTTLEPSFVWWEVDGESYFEFPVETELEGDNIEDTVTATRTVPDETTPEEMPTDPVTPDTPDTPDSSDLGITDVVTPELFNTVMDEIVALLPVVIPVMVGFIALRKGISFLQSVLHSA